MEPSAFESNKTAVVLDQCLLWGEAVECILRRAGVNVVGKSTSGDETLALILRLRPHLLVTDVAAVEGAEAGLACLRKALEHVPELRAVVLAASADEDDIHEALAAGASAYVVKSAHPDDLASAVRQAFAHSVYFASSFSRQNGRTRDVAVHADGPDLTNREREILQLVAEGIPNAQVAGMLWVTEQTVKFHLSNVYRKLNVSNRTEAARWAQLNGLVPIPRIYAV